MDATVDGGRLGTLFRGSAAVIILGIASSRVARRSGEVPRYHCRLVFPWKRGITLSEARINRTFPMRYIWHHHLYRRYWPRVVSTCNTGLTGAVHSNDGVV